MALCLRTGWKKGLWANWFPLRPSDTGLVQDCVLGWSALNPLWFADDTDRLKRRLVGLVVRRPPRERKIPGSNPVCAGIFSGSSHTSDSKIGTPVATLPGAWRYRVSAGTGRPGVSRLWLGEVESLICNFCLSVAARKIVWADPSLRYTSMLLGR